MNTIISKSLADGESSKITLPSDYPDLEVRDYARVPLGTRE
jgi:hypothetical protein